MLTCVKALRERRKCFFKLEKCCGLIQLIGKENEVNGLVVYWIVV